MKNKETNTCECSLEKMSNDIVAKLSEGHPDWAINTDGYELGFQHRTFAGRLYNNFKYAYTFTKRNGETSIEKTATCSIFPTYCCFCGKLFKEE